MDVNSISKMNSLFSSIRKELVKKTYEKPRCDYNIAFFKSEILKTLNELDVKTTQTELLNEFEKSSAIYLFHNARFININEDEERKLEQYIFNDYDIEDYNGSSFKTVKESFNAMLEGLSSELFYYKDDIDQNTYNYIEYLLNVRDMELLETYYNENEYRYNYDYLYMAKRFKKIVEFRLDSEI